MFQQIVRCGLRRAGVPRGMLGIDAAYRNGTDVVCCGPRLALGERWPAQVVAGLADGRIVLMHRGEVAAGVAWAAGVKFIVKG